MFLLFPPAPVRIALFALACALIAWLSLAPGEDLPQALTFWDKAEHATAYLGLTLVGAWAFPERLRRLALGLFLAGVGVEILQAIMGLGRQGDPVDAVANSVGIAVGLGVAMAARRLLGTRVR
ncbi:MAG: VanZ family protein [Caulobacter sp.]|nr:VanZ family protein [Caulobacter sp.]